jgi:Uma2 family endonuclease
VAARCHRARGLRGWDRVLRISNMVAHNRQPLLEPRPGVRDVIDGVAYPESDGLPMADNTLQFDRIVLIKTNLDDRLPDFVGGDLFWYPVEGRPDIVVAPDVLVALGRPKGMRRSYKQWMEDGIAPKVVFEVLSPNNTLREMMHKAAFYLSHGVQEFYVIDPDEEVGWAEIQGSDGVQIHVRSLDGWTSPLLGIQFRRTESGLVISDRDGNPFEDTVTLRQRAEAEAQRAEAEAQRAEAEAQRAEAALERAKALEEKLRALGVSVD